ncbi:D-alanyl-D-alanine carboxypeptidase [Aerococcus mictus]|nr:D-alanyl-D-alanine carboxypeptidase [Aerococcus mictus]
MAKPALFSSYPTNNPATRRLISMKTVTKKIASSVAGALLALLLFASPVLASGETVADFSDQLTQSQQYGFKHAIAIDQESGQILYQKAADDLHGIASLTKLLSLYVIYDQLAQGKLSLDEAVPVSPALAKQSQAEGLSNVPLVAGPANYSVDQLIDAVIIASANSATVALAEKVAGSEDHFIELMAQKLDQLGIKDYNLVSASGLRGELRADARPGQYSETEENQISAKSLALVVQRLLNDYPDIQSRSQVEEKVFQVAPDWQVTMTNSNQLLPGMTYGRRDITGLKTGTELGAGYCLVATSFINQRPVILVTLGAGSNEDRFVETSRLLTDLQNRLDWIVLIPQGALYNNGEEVEIYGGNKATTQLQYGNTVACFVPQNYSISDSPEADFTEPASYSMNGNLEVNAPLEEGEAVNTEILHIPFVDSVDGQLALATDLMPTENVKRVSPFVQITRKVHESMQFISDWLNAKIAEYSN